MSKSLNIVHLTYFWKILAPTKLHYIAFTYIFAVLMAVKNDIEETFRQYLEATYTQDFDRLYTLLYEYDLEEFREKVVILASQMDEFGETKDFLGQMGIASLKKLQSMALPDFMRTVFSMTTRKVGKETLKKIISGLKITAVEDTDFYSIVHYEYPVQIYDEWELYKGDCQMIRSQNRWQLFLKSGLEVGLSRFQQEIDSYLERKKRDRPENLTHEADLTPFTLTGYKDFSSGKVVIEPRFRDAGEFSEGLAPVQIMTKYGYTDTRGELVITPQYLAAGEFSEGLAAVKVSGKKGEEPLWGFIDPKGKMIIPPQFSETGTYSQALCAVRSGDKWGYIDLEGNMIIPAKFDLAGDFEDGRVEVKLKAENSDTEAFSIDKKGNILRAHG